MVFRTIAAISSPTGSGRRGILRLSGGEARAIANEALVDPRPALQPESGRSAFSATFFDGWGPQPALVFWMPGPRSYTGEDVLELHLPGCEPLLARAFERLLALGAAAAAPGEFTRRAFLHGKLDLTQAEGVLELVQATNDAERRSALLLLEGGLARRVHVLRDLLEDVRALFEASLDFDELDSGHVPLADLARRLAEVDSRLREALAFETARQTPAALPRVVLSGAPNAGKSSLFNALVGREAALVSDWPGTTRDALAAVLSLDQGPLLLVDLPGLDRAASGPDAEAQRRAQIERESAELLLWVIDGARASDAGIERELEGLPSERGILLVWNKADLAPAEPARARAHPLVSLSALQRTGLERLREALAEALGLFREEPRSSRAGDVSRELFLRHRKALERSLASVALAREHLGAPLDLCAEMLREATAALDEICGRTTPENLLERIFERFCIGK